MERIRLLDLGVSHVKGNLRSGEVTVREKQSRPREKRRDSGDRASSC